jgi:hypothetical protein
VISLCDLLVPSLGVAQKSLNDLGLLGLGELVFVLLKNAFGVAPLGGSDPLQNVLFRLVALFQVDPVGVVVLVCYTLGGST